MKELMPSVLGNEETKRTLIRAIENHRLPQVLILEGDLGSGKKTFAKEIVSSVFCSNREKGSKSIPCGECRPCTRVRDGITPDVVYIRAESGKATIGVDAVRTITERLSIGPCEMPMLFFIVEKADTMTPQAQNAWLLTLENPPEDVAFILLCENAEKLLETVRSRSVIFRMEAFEADRIADYISRNTESLGLPSSAVDNRERLLESAVSSGGSIGKAVSLLDSRSSEELHKKRDFSFRAAEYITLRQGNAKERILFSEAFSGAREPLLESVSMLSQIFRDLIVIKKSDNAPLTFFTPSQRERAEDMADACTMNFLYFCRDSCENALSSLTANGSVKGIRLSLLLHLGLLT